jgi:hypothetical protein
MGISGSVPRPRPHLEWQLSRSGRDAHGLRLDAISAAMMTTPRPTPINSPRTNCHTGRRMSAGGSQHRRQPLDVRRGHVEEPQTHIERGWTSRVQLDSPCNMDDCPRGRRRNIAISSAPRPACVDRIRHRPSSHGPGEDVGDSGQVEVTLANADVFDIGPPRPGPPNRRRGCVRPGQAPASPPASARRS